MSQFLTEDQQIINSLKSENKKLREDLIKANTELEKYERLYYLEKNKNEDLTEELTDTRSLL